VKKIRNLLIWSDSTNLTSLNKCDEFVAYNFDIWSFDLNISEREIIFRFSHPSQDIHQSQEKAKRRGL